MGGFPRVDPGTRSADCSPETFLVEAEDGERVTTEEKKDRRAARHEVEAALKRRAIQKLGFYSTGPQIQHGLRVLCDRFFSEQVTPAAKRIEAQVLAEQGQTS